MRRRLASCCALLAVAAWTAALVPSLAPILAIVVALWAVGALLSAPGAIHRALERAERRDYYSRKVLQSKGIIR